MNFRVKTVLYCGQLLWLNLMARGSPELQAGAAMRNPKPKPFAVTQNGKPLFTIHAYSLDQARAIVAAKIAGETIVVAVTPDGAAR
jgi:hypothetical protein